ncbi:hypothetical protein EMN47_01490 [Prolixibacteraceae bacterium JC049]|nr:hypothetical protein [Prolixibacteraceae bacterium JC049]
MFGKRLIFFLFLLTVLFSSGKWAVAQDDKESAAIEAFEEKDYNAAYPVFKELVRLYPNDVKLNYYYVVSAVATKNDLTALQANMGVALKNQSKKDIFYYAGLYAELNKKWDDAIGYYKQFQEEGRKKEVKAFNIEERINYCNTQKNIVPVEEPKDTIKAEKIVEVTKVEESQKEEVAVVEEVTIPETLAQQLIEIQITPSVVFKHISQFKSKSAQQLYIQLWKNEERVAELNEEMAQLREKYSASQDFEEREKIASTILDDENEILTLRQSILTIPKQLIAEEQKEWKKATEQEIATLNDDSKNWEQKLAPKTESENQEENIANKTIIIQTPPEEIVQDEYVYKIQIGAYRKKLPTYVKRLFDKIAAFRPVENYTDEKGIVVYTTGKAHNYADALKLLKQVRREGVKDASIAAYKNDKRITVREAKLKTN